MSLNLYCWIDGKLSGLPVPPEDVSISLMTLNNDIQYTLTGDDIYLVWYEYISWILSNNEDGLELKRNLFKFFDAKDIEFRLL